jgi:hypothetical protein
MKAQTQMIGLVVAMLLVPSAFAEETAAKKAVTRIDFNKMIDANSSDKNDLEKSVNDKVAVKGKPVAKTNTDKNAVIDFVDEEMNMAKERPIVDRRFNSVGAPRIATEFSNTEFTVQLISKK